MFYDLSVDVKYTIEFNIKNSSCKPDEIWNTKKVWRWGSAITGTVGAVGGILGLFSGPVGWTIFGAGLLCGLFSWFCDSREKKLETEKRKIRNTLNSSIDKMRKDAHGFATKMFEQEIKEKLLNNTYMRFTLLRTSMITLVNSQRMLAMKYNDIHCNVTKKMVKEALRHNNEPDWLIENIEKVARIPGRRMFILLKQRKIVKTCTLNALCETMGSKEKIETYSLMYTDLKGQAFQLFKYFKMTCKPYFCQIDDRIVGTQNVIYVDNRNYTQNELDNMNLIEQLLNVHIIKR